MATFQLRPAEAADLGSICALINRAETHDRVPRRLTLEELTQDLSGPDVDLTADVRVATAGGEIAGWAGVWNPDVDAGDDWAALLGEVDPDHRGRGIGRALLDWSIERASERLRSREHDRARVLRVHAPDWLTDRQRLYARFGLEPVRWFDEMLRPLAEPTPIAPVAPGFALVPYAPERDEEIRSARNAGFADHWGSAPISPDAWQRFVHGHGGRPDLSFLVLDERDRVVGVCINHAYPEDDEVTGRRDAWVMNVSTLREHRGKGLASAMIARSLDAFTAAGFTHAMLTVDSDSPTGAHRLYRRLGFDPLHRNVTNELPLTGGKS